MTGNRFFNNFVFAEAPPLKGELIVVDSAFPGVEVHHYENGTVMLRFLYDDGDSSKRGPAM